MRDRQPKKLHYCRGDVLIFLHTSNKINVSVYFGLIRGVARHLFSSGSPEGMGWGVCKVKNYQVDWCKWINVK